MADTQLSASSVWEWNNSLGQRSVWAPPGARLKSGGLPWAPAQSDQHQWLQVDLKKEKRITGRATQTVFKLRQASPRTSIQPVFIPHPGITTSGSTLREYQYYVSAYRVLYSSDGQRWAAYREHTSPQDKVIQAAQSITAHSALTSSAFISQISANGQKCHFRKLQGRKLGLFPRQPVLTGRCLWQEARAVSGWS